MEYEVWHTETNELVGRIEVLQPVDEVTGTRVIIRCKKKIYHRTKGQFNAVEMLVCRMVNKDKSKYYALETNLPMNLLKVLEGFTPRIRIPNLFEIFSLNRSRMH